MSVNHEDLNVDLELVQQHFNLWFVNKGDEETETQSSWRRGFQSVFEKIIAVHS